MIRRAWRTYMVAPLEGVIAGVSRGRRWGVGHFLTATSFTIAGIRSDRMRLAASAPCPPE
jgi:hypothetical protein